MRTIDLYLLRQTSVTLFAATIVALLALLLERMLRLFGLTANSSVSIPLIFEMLMNLIPNYLGMALPVAFLLAVMLTFDRLSKESEFAVMNAMGIGLHRMVVPFIALAAVLAIVFGIVYGFLQPYGRYAYRSLVHAVTSASLSAALEERAFVRIGDMTFMAESISRGGERLTRVFVHETRRDGSSVTTTAPEGALLESRENLRSILYLSDGVRVTIDADGSNASVLSFDEFRRPLGEARTKSFRQRGKDERELTLFELWTARGSPPAGVRADEISAEFHGQLVRILTILFLPLLSIPLGLGSPRQRRSYGIAVGLIVLIVYYKALQLGESLTSLGEISLWLGLWLPFALFASASTYLFFRASFKVGGNSFAALFDGLARAVAWLNKTLPRTAR